MMIKCYDNLSEVFFSDQKQKSEDISYSCETLDWYFFFLIIWSVSLDETIF